jgi:RNA polymerase sigma factor (sigma-70 family)
VNGDESDAIDARLLAEGDLDRLFARHYDDLLSRAVIHLRDRDGAADAVQTAVMRVLRELRAGKDHGYPMRVVLHQVLTYTLRGWGTPIEDPLSEVDEPRDTRADEQLAAVDHRAWLDGVLDVLPPRVRDVTRMRFGQGREIAEIAQELGIERNAVDQALHRGRAALRRAWLDG